MQDKKVWRSKALWLSAAAILCLLFLPWTKNEQVEPVSVEVKKTQTESELSHFYLARIHSVEGDSFSDGQWLEKGAYTFKDKTALTFDSGVELNVEAGAELELLGSNEAILHGGKVQAHVPEVAIGFVLKTPSSDILDLGTEFAVQVDEQGATAVEVLIGEVELTPNAAEEQKLLLRKNERLHVQRSGVISREIQPLSPVDSLPNKLEIRELAYVHWPFDDLVSGLSSALSKPQRQDDLSARFMEGKAKATDKNEGPELSYGVFGSALKLDGVNDLVETDYLGIDGAKPRTVSFWMRVPKKTQQGKNYAVVHWGNPTRKSEKWQIGWNALGHQGNLGAIRTEFKQGYVIGETDLRDGKWHHIVSLFIGGENADVATHVRHYIDGKLESVSGYQRAKIKTNIDDPHSRPVTFGRKLEGGSNYLKASLDELYIIEGAVTPGQIRKLKNKNSLK